MAEVYLSMNYNLHVTDKEVRLICLGLSGKLKRTEDIGDAQKLNLRLLEQSQIRIGEQRNKIEGALKTVVEEEERAASTKKADVLAEAAKLNQRLMETSYVQTGPGLKKA